MASTFSTNLAIELIGTGDQAGTWGTTTNSNLGTLIEQAISGYVTQAVATGTDTTITIPNGSTGVARNMYIELTGTGGASTNLIVPANKKLYFIFNNSTGAVTVKVSGQTGVSVPTGKKMVLVSNGTDIVNGLNYIADFGTNSFSVTNLTASSATITNLIATSGSITNLVSSDASATVLRAGSATLTHLSATSASITNLALTSLTISSLSVTNVSVASATVSSNLTLSGGTANGVLYLNGSKVATSGSALTYNGSNLINTNGYVSTSGDFRLNNATFSRVAIGDGGGGFVGGYNITYSGSPIYDSTGAISGVYYSSSGNVQFFAGGSAAAGTAAPEAMRLTASGNLGIGTSSPASKLHVDSDATNTTVTIESDLDGGSLFTSGINLLREGTVAGSRIQSIRDAGAGGVGLNFLTTADNAAEIAGTLTSRMVIDRSGNVGIGTASPGVKFHVANDGAGEADVARFSRTNAGDLHLLDIGVNPDTNFVTFDSTGSAAGGYTFRRGGTDAMTLDSSGNLGIGTSSPGAPLNVKKNSAAAVVEMLRLTNDGPGAGSMSKINFDASGTSYGAITGGYGASGPQMKFELPSSTSGSWDWIYQSTTLATLLTSGNLGIGTTSPTVPLDVQSNSSGNGIIIRGRVTANTGTLRFYANNGTTQQAKFEANDSTVEVGSITNVPLLLLSNGTERARILSSGEFLAGATSAVAVAGVTGFHALSADANNKWAAVVRNTNSSTPFGLAVNYSAAAPNNTSSNFVYCYDSGALRASIRANGGLANYQANNVDLSDARTKKDIIPAASMWGKVSALEIVTYKYNDQTHDDVNLGVIAQQVEAVEPVWVDADGFGDTPEDGVPLKTVYTKDITFAAIKALQEAMARIEQLEAKVATLESK